MPRIYEETTTSPSANARSRLVAAATCLVLAGCGVVEKDDTSNDNVDLNAETNVATNGVTDQNSNSDQNNINQQSGGGGQGDACTGLSDCESEFNCDDGVCREECDDDDQCADGFVCREGVDTTISLCQERESPFVLIEDVSTSEACGGFDPGSDLFGVALYDGEETLLGWGQTAWADVEPSDFEDTGVLDGRPPAGGGSCPEFSETNVVALGCGGQIVVSFLDSSGDPIPIESGYFVEIHEYGFNCPNGSASDTYDAYFCIDELDPGLGFLESCNTSLVTGGSGRERAVIP